MLQLFNLPLRVLLLGFVLGSAPVWADVPTLVLSHEQLKEPVDVPASLVLEDPSGDLTAG